MPTRRTLLVVEDDNDLRELFRFVLAQAGHDVLTASNGLQALRQLDARLFDLVILDLVLPAVDGHAVLEELAASPHLQRTPVIIVTATDLQPVTRNVICTLRKPVTGDALLATIEECFARVRTP